MQSWPQALWAVTLFLNCFIYYFLGRGEKSKITVWVLSKLVFEADDFVFDIILSLQWKLVHLWLEERIKIENTKKYNTAIKWQDIENTILVLILLVCNTGRKVE